MKGGTECRNWVAAGLGSFTHACRTATICLTQSVLKVVSQKSIVTQIR